MERGVLVECALITRGDVVFIVVVVVGGVRIIEGMDGVALLFVVVVVVSLVGLD